MQAFISHASADRRFVDQLRDMLQAHGVRTWTPEHEIRAGEDFTLAIDRAINECDAILFVMSPESSRSDWASMELSIARARQMKTGKPLIIPVLADKSADPPIFLRMFQYVDMSDPERFDRNGPMLIEALESASESKTTYDTAGKVRQIKESRELLESEKTLFSTQAAKLTRLSFLVSTIAAVTTVLATGVLFLVQSNQRLDLLSGAIGFGAGILASLIAWRIIRAK